MISCSLHSPLPTLPHPPPPPPPIPSGQTRDVHIYRLISEQTIEENILKKVRPRWRQWQRRPRARTATLNVTLYKLRVSFPCWNWPTNINFIILYTSLFCRFPILTLTLLVVADYFSWSSKSPLPTFWPTNVSGSTDNSFRGFHWLTISLPTHTSSTARYVLKRMKEWDNISWAVD